MARQNVYAREFRELVRLEPRLANLRALVQRAKPCSGWCANEFWYRRVKPRLVLLVGWERPDRHPVLGTPTAYDVAYSFLYDALPDCRHRGMFC